MIKNAVGEALNAGNRGSTGGEPRSQNTKNVARNDRLVRT